MNTVSSLITLALIISTALILVNSQLSTMKPNNEKLSPYECGFDPLKTMRLPFSIRFFLVAILFLLFDLEIALLLPLPWAIQLTTPTNTLMLTFAILLLLTLGFIYEWTQGGLEWAE
uniref:NADH-ubiquinone oxidoreductase chain 3 n=1 Tax=Apalone ferox TaxID=100213 RepID=D5G1S4_APAFE|nr:NADH dehydrogenase subunit 3 [Apalone ferox]ACO83389.1 NADH dehydrogenase subunit 3 [Apalone ferox]ARR28330.1 NADH dehydrogenase subunit 3 [Apalone ferox]